jgi:Lipopolysaccharide-assembly, LptC-related
MPSCRSARWRRSARLSFLFVLLGSALALGGSKHRRNTPTPNPGASPEAIGLKNIPLTVGHEAKGLVLPNYDLQGRLVGRFEAATASRLDENHVHFKDLKMQTFDEKEQPDFKIAMSDGILNLDSRVLESKKRSKISRADFEIAGDEMKFNTETHQGTLSGKVHMTIYNQKEIAGGARKK